jgi:hypothetical protein
MLAAGKSMPTPSSNIGGRVVPWSRVVYLGGDQVYSGDALFTKFQGIYQPKLVWVRGRVRTNAVLYYDSSKTYITGFDERITTARTLVTAGAIQVGSSLGVSSFLSGTGIFTTTQGVTLKVLSGGGIVIAEGVDTGGDGIVVAEGVEVGDGIVVAEGVVIAEGIAIAEGIVISEGVVVAEQGPMAGE